MRSTLVGLTVICVTASTSWADSRILIQLGGTATESFTVRMCARPLLNHKLSGPGSFPSATVALGQTALAVRNDLINPGGTWTKQGGHRFGYLKRTTYAGKPAVYAQSIQADEGGLPAPLVVWLDKLGDSKAWAPLECGTPGVTVGGITFSCLEVSLLGAGQGASASIAAPGQVGFGNDRAQSKKETVDKSTTNSRDIIQECISRYGRDGIEDIKGAYTRDKAKGQTYDGAYASFLVSCDHACDKGKDKMPEAARCLRDCLACAIELIDGVYGKTN